MQWPLILAGLAMGVAATPHCAVMCAAPCSALTGGDKHSTTSFQVGRLISYMLVGSLAACSVATLGVWSEAVPALRPLWTLLHLAFMGLGLWWVLTGEQPAWLRRDDTVSIIRMPGRQSPVLRAGLSGLVWAAWPCAALQAALVLAALANTPLAGAMVMGAFAVASMPGLLLAPWAWKHWQAHHGTTPSPGQLSLHGFRIAGLGLVLACGWALTHDLWQRFATWCAT
ncbi:sulfite exporter TauE/SafE family protein [Aquabacterium sp.]|uniref:sulfite exporter TauE/SafE family protein n=1 Tax=Aquabacterium sp. TaxID=1872578 RepID=UPI0019A92CC5|nr:sulfite exporter TauE/SafE family protein [Aquabacterium sp.]MBC7701014.1 sulfite exporter TauE/SafE family protein [Aquabacterium sp.]